MKGEDLRGATLQGAKTGFTTLGLLIIQLPLVLIGAAAGYWVLAHAMAWLFEGVTLGAFPFL